MLHLYFYSQRFPDYGKEWFYYDQSIIDYFNTHKVIEDFFDLDYLKDKIDYSIKITKKKDIADKVVKYLTNFGKLDSSNSISEYIQILEKFSDVSRLDEFKAWKIIEEDYGIIQDEVISFIDSEINIDIPDPIMSEVDDFMIKFRSVPYFTDKMKLLCESGLSDKALSLVLKQVPIDYSTFYTTLGPSKIKSLSYQKSRLMSESNKILNNTKISDDVVKNSFLKVFKLGSRITLSEAKSLISKIYLELGLNKTARAKDLEQFFEVKLVKIPKMDKRADGYEIISKKEN